MLYVITILIALCIFIWVYFLCHFNYWTKRQIPHDAPKIPNGNMQKWTRSKHFAQIFSETYKNFKGRGPYAGFYFNTQKAVIILDLRLAKSILVKDFTYFESRGLFHDETTDPLTGNLFLLDGPKWRSLRTKILFAFSAGKMRYMFPTVFSVTEGLIRMFNEKLAENAVIEITDIVGRFSADVIAVCAFGLSDQSLHDPNDRYCQMARKFFTTRRSYAIVGGFVNTYPKLAQLFRMRVIRKEVSEFFMRIFTTTFKYRLKKNVKRCDFMDLLMELKNQPNDKGNEDLTWDEMATQAFTFLIAGFDSTSATISYALYELARNTEIQDKLRDEIEETLELYGQDFCYECLMDMRYLKQVINETLRKYPVEPALFRKCVKRYETNNPHYFIEKDCMVIIPTLSFHHDAEYFPEPDTFDPERFSQTNFKNVKPCSYLPFGQGPRNCIGMRFGMMHTSIGLAQLIRYFKFEISNQTQIPITYDVSTYNLIPRNGITLRVTRV